MEESKLKQLKQFVELCKLDPSILSDPSLSFFRDYIERYKLIIGVAFFLKLVSGIIQKLEGATDIQKNETYKS